MELSKELLRIIRCPISGGKLEYDKEKAVLISQEAGVTYPIKNGIPMLLASEATKILSDNNNYPKEKLPA